MQQIISGIKNQIQNQSMFLKAPYEGIHTVEKSIQSLSPVQKFSSSEKYDQNTGGKIRQKTITENSETPLVNTPYDWSTIHLFECSWEVCNKVGGIYTVVTTKMPFMQSVFGDRYFLIGPYESGIANPEFQQKAPPVELQEIFDDVRSMGIACYYGTWISGCKPQVILIDCKNYSYANNSVKQKLWEIYGIDSLGTDFFDFDKPMLWSWCAGMIIERYAKKKKVHVVAQLHEWLAGAAALHLKQAFPINPKSPHEKQVATIFTTHATVLGRSLASQSDSFYDDLNTYDTQKAEQIARQRGVIAKHLLERESARNADIFTTVSEITANEAVHFLGRKPDIITYNGMLLPIINDDNASSVRRNARTTLLELAMSAFTPNKKINPHKTTIFATFGRYEFHVKGIDTVIKALGLLNQRLIKEGSDKEALCFFCIPAGTYGIQQELLVSKAKLNDIEESIYRHRELILFNLAYDVVENPTTKSHEVLSQQLIQELSLKIKSFKIPIPTLHATHYLHNQDNDPIMQTCKHEQLLNSFSDKVNVLFIPIYLTGYDGIVDLTYHETIQGIDAGLFPSFYEPWGYTPFETAAYGIPAVTTDAAGFGSFVKNVAPDQKGVVVLPRQHASMDETAESLAEYMYETMHDTRETRLHKRASARHVAEKGDWAVFVKYYLEAYGRALGLKRIK